VSCEICEEAREIDGDIPDCETAKGCIIPPLTDRGKRIMAMREKLIRLKDLVDPATILAMYGATLNDLELLSKVEELIESVKGTDAGR
jgi:hypothetical protein